MKKYIHVLSVCLLGIVFVVGISISLDLLSFTMTLAGFRFNLPDWPARAEAMMPLQFKETDEIQVHWKMSDRPSWWGLRNDYTRSHWELICRNYTTPPKVEILNPSDFLRNYFTTPLNEIYDGSAICIRPTFDFWKRQARTYISGV